MPPVVVLPHGEEPSAPLHSGPHSGDLGVHGYGGVQSLGIQGIQEALLEPGTEAPKDELTHPIPKWKRRYMVGIFSVMAALIFSDQNLLAPHLTQAAEDFGFTEDQRDALLGGVIMAAFFCVGAPAALIIGWLTDKTNRRNLLFVVVIIGAVPGIATYWVTEYWELVLCRTLTGVSVGGTFPLIYSLLGDLFPISMRAGMSAFILIATGAGIAAGQGLSSITGASNWRLPFLIIAAPSIVLAGVMLLTTVEPPRGFYEEALKDAYAAGDEYKETITWPKVKLLLRVPSNWLIIWQGLPGSLPWGMMMTFFNDYLSQNKGFSVQVATVIVLLFGLGGGLGVVVGGVGGQWLYNKRKEYMPVFVGVSVLLGIGPLFYLVNAPLHDLSLGGTCVMSLIGGFLASIAGPNVRAVVMNVNEPETRGVAFALQTLTDDLGKGLGPVIVAGFISSMGRTGAFNLATAGWIPCAILLLSLMFCMRRDEAAMQARLQAKVEASQQRAAENGRSVSRGGLQDAVVGPYESANGMQNGVPGFSANGGAALQHAESQASIASSVDKSNKRSKSRARGQSPDGNGAMEEHLLPQNSSHVLGMDEFASSPSQQHSLTQHTSDGANGRVVSPLPSPGRNNPSLHLAPSGPPPAENGSDAQGMTPPPPLPVSTGSYMVAPGGHVTLPGQLSSRSSTDRVSQPDTRTAAPPAPSQQAVTGKDAGG